MGTPNKKILELIQLVISRKGYTVLKDDKIDVNYLITSIINEILESGKSLILAQYSDNNLRANL